MSQQKRENSLGASSKAPKADTRDQSPAVKPPAGYDLATPQETEVGFLAAYAALDLLMRSGTPHPEQRSHLTLTIPDEIELSVRGYRSSATTSAKTAVGASRTTVIIEVRYFGRSVMTVEWVRGRDRQTIFDHMKYITGAWINALLDHHQLQLQDKE